MGGLWATIPKMAAVTLFFTIASLGLPGLGNFVGEFLVLLGTFQVTVAATVFATLGIVAVTIYALALMQRTFYGALSSAGRIPDLSTLAMATFAAMIAVQVWLGVAPQPVLAVTEPALQHLEFLVAPSAVASAR